MCIKKLKINRLDCLDESKGRKHPFIASRIIDRLKNFYKPYDEEFFKTIKHEPFWQIMNRYYYFHLLKGFMS